MITYKIRETRSPVGGAKLYVVVLVSDVGEFAVCSCDNPTDARMHAAAHEAVALLREWADGLKFVDGKEQPTIEVDHRAPDEVYAEQCRARLRRTMDVNRDFGDRVDRFLAEVGSAPVIVPHPRCDATYAFSKTENWICQLDAGHKGAHVFPDPALTVT